MFSRAWFRSTDLWVMGPARFHCATLLSILYYSDPQLASEQPADSGLMKQNKKILSEVGFEPTPTEVDCDLNAAP